MNDLFIDDDLLTFHEGFNHQENEPWHVLIADDEKDIHATIKLLLGDFSYANRQIIFHDAYSASDLQSILCKETNMAVVFLDVVMEDNHSGLDMVKHIRDILKNKFIRIVILTGQPGYAPETTVIREYEINDYKTKTELTAENLFNVTYTSLRAYEAISEVERYSKGLEKMVEERTEALNIKTNLLEVANITKEKLISLLAHDLSTPISSITGLTNILKSGFNSLPDEEKLEIIEDISTVSKSIYSLFENVILWMKSQSDKLIYNQETFDLTCLVNECVNLLKINIEKKNISINLHPKCCINVTADKNMMSAVIRNLISNAIKFSHTDSVIEVAIKHHNESTELIIKDHGLGMNDYQIQNLFELKKGMSTPGTLGETGTGLGLKICKEFIEKHNGSILVNSTVGKGSTFSITIP